MMERLELFSNMETMISSGISMIDTVDSLLEDAKGDSRKILLILQDDLNEGRSIGYSFEKSPKAFDIISLQLIKAAEQSGTIDVTLRDLVKDIKKDIAFVEKVKHDISYPFFIMIVFIGVIVLLLVYVIPRIAIVFTRLNMILPAQTNAMIFASSFFLKYNVYIITLFACIIAFLSYLYSTRKQEFMNAFFSLPLLYPLGRDIDITRISRSIALLLSSGIPLLSCLDMVNEIALQHHARNAVKKAREAVFAGKKLSQGFQLSKAYLPPSMIRIIEAGEKSGALEKSFIQISERSQIRVESKLLSITTLLEPILILFIGLAVGSILLAVISPIYSLIGNISTR